MILITGATGTVGSLIVQGLRQSGVDFAVLSRNSQRSKVEAGNIPTLIEGSIENVADWLPTLPSNLTVFSLAAVTPNMAQLEMAFFEALSQHGVNHIVKLSAWRASSQSPVDIVRQHGQAEEYLKVSGLPYTIIQAQYFMQNLLGFGAMVAQTHKLKLPLGTERCALIDAADIAAVAVKCLLNPVGHQSRIHALTGPELLTFHDVAQALSGVLGKPILYEPIGAIEFRQMLESWDVSGWLATSLAEVFISLAGGDATYMTDTVEQVTGRKPIRLATFLETNRDVFTE